MTEVQPMTSSMRPVPDGVSELEFAQLLEAGRKRGYLTQEDLVEVLRTVELSHDVIADAVLAVRAAGIQGLLYFDTGASTLTDADEEALAQAINSPAG